MQKLFIISAPSGSGKTSIIKHLLSLNLPLEFSISATSRPKRSGEIHGKDYYFLSAAKFSKKIENEEFLEWEEVYERQFYGTLKSEIDRIKENGNHVIFDVDVLGGLDIKNYYGTQALAIFIQPPSLKELEERLLKRSTDSLTNIKKRLTKAKQELEYANKYDVVIVNDILETACAKAEQLVRDFIQA